MEKTLQFQLEKDTKNTYRFKEVGDEPAIGTLYVQKSLFAGKEAPKSLEVTLRTA